jgi:hypothetical protein
MDDATLSQFYKELRPYVIPIISQYVHDAQLHSILTDIYSEDAQTRVSAAESLNTLVTDKTRNLTVTSVLASGARRALTGWQRLLVSVNDMSPSERLIALAPALATAGISTVTQSGTDDILNVAFTLALVGLTNVTTMKQLRLNGNIDRLRSIQKYCTKVVTMFTPAVTSSVDHSAVALGLASHLLSAVSTQISSYERETGEALAGAEQARK